jgi:AcrR family transcriptional regulator
MAVSKRRAPVIPIAAKVDGVPAETTPGPKAAPVELARYRKAAREPRKPRSTDMAKTLQAAALDLFASQNYSTVTIKDISEASGVNPSLIYYYFGSKEELFLEAVESTVAEAFLKFETIREQATEPEEIIGRWIETHIVQFKLMQRLAKISLDYANTHNRTARIDKAIRKFYDKEAVVLRRAIRAGIKKGIFRPVDANETSTFISTFLDGALFRQVMFPAFDHKAAIANMRAMVLSHLTGDRPAPSAPSLLANPLLAS